MKPRRTMWKTIALMLVVFLLGNLTGISGASAVMLRKLQSNIRNPDQTNGPASRLIDRTEEKISGELKLTPAERQAVHEELETSRGHLTEIRGRMIGDLRFLARDTVDRISGRLPEEKRKMLRERAAQRLRPWGFSAGE